MDSRLSRSSKSRSSNRVRFGSCRWVPSEENFVRPEDLDSRCLPLMGCRSSREERGVQFKPYLLAPGGRSLVARAVSEDRCRCKRKRCRPGAQFNPEYVQLGGHGRAQRSRGCEFETTAKSPGREVVWQAAVNPCYPEISGCSSFLCHARLASVGHEGEALPPSCSTFRRRVKACPILNLLRRLEPTCVAYQTTGFRSKL